MMLNMSYDDYMDLNDYDFSDTRVETAIFLYVYPVFLVVGASGNVLSVVLLRHFSHTTSSTVVYLVAVSVIDLLILLIRCGNDWLRVMVDYDLSQRLMVHSDVICKVYPFVFNFALHASKWLVVAAAVEGAVSTARPARVAITCTLTRARSTMLLMSVLLVCVNMHYFWSYELVEIKDYGVCVVTCTFTRYGHYVSEMFVENVFPVINLLLNDILPETIVAVCAGVMAVNVARGRHRGDDKLRAWQARYLLDPESHDHIRSPSWRCRCATLSSCYQRSPSPSSSSSWRNQVTSSTRTGMTCRRTWPSSCASWQRMSSYPSSYSSISSCCPSSAHTSSDCSHGAVAAPTARTFSHKAPFIY